MLLGTVPAQMYELSAHLFQEQLALELMEEIPKADGNLLGVKGNDHRWDERAPRSNYLYISDGKHTFLCAKSQVNECLVVWK